MRKQKFNFWNAFLVIGLAVSLLIQGSLIAYAGTLTVLKDRLNRQIQNQTSGIIHLVVFTTALAVSGGDGNNKVILVFPDSDDGKWCRTAGTDLTVSGCTEDSANALQGTPALTARCTKGAGVSNYDTIYIEQVNNLSGLTAYCVQISDGTIGKLGTPTHTTTGVITVKTNDGSNDVDSGKLSADIITNDQVVVTANVPSAEPSPGGGGGAPRTNVIIQGKAYPLSSVTILQDGRVTSTTTADSLANFEIEITNITAGIWTFGIWAKDTDGRKSITVSFTFSVASGMTTTISGIFLPPTIEIDKTFLQRGETLNILGQTAPQSEVSVFVNSPEEIVKKTTADKRGNWDYPFDTSILDEGSHTTRAKAISPEGLLSSYSKVLSFSVGKVRVEELCPRADLNKDGRTNLVDFSILLYWWGRDNACTDQNQDGIVNLTDFSIMLYWWTG